MVTIFCLYYCHKYWCPTLRHT